MLGLAVAGCSSPRPLVFVDVDRVLAGEERFEAPASLPPSGSRSGTSASIATAPLKARSVEDRLLKERAENLDEQMARVRADSAKRLKDDLYKGLLRQLERDHAAASAELDARFVALLEKAHAEAVAAFEIYAEGRWPIASELAPIVGYPFPPRTKLKEPPPEKIWELKRYRRAQELYASLDEIEARQNQSVRRIYEVVDLKISDLRLNLGVDLVKKVEELEVQAERAAQEAVSSANEAINLVLSSRPEFRLPPIEGQTSSVAVEGHAPTAIHADTVKKPDIISIRAQVEASARVWADLKGYRLSAIRQGAREETEAFIRWRRKYGSGL
jgi:hypothetical protein